MVRCVTFEIRWHDTLPIYSCAFQPIAAARLQHVLDHNFGQAAGLVPGQTLSSADGGAVQPLQAGGQSWRLATAGGDNNVRLWMVHPNVPSPAAIAAATGNARPLPPRTEYLATLSRHTGVVNAVRFSPGGDVLASAGDDGMVLLWVRSNRAFERDMSADVDERYEKETWRVRSVVRVTAQEVYDLAWSPDGMFLAAGGTDFCVRVINIHKGAVVREINDHQHYVQGLAWDPRGEFLATESSDRSMHVYRGAAVHAKSAKIGTDESASGVHAEAVDGAPAAVGEQRGAPPPPPIAAGALLRTAPPAQRMYGDDRYSGFFRRLGWSPDGALLAAPSGQFASTGKPVGAVYIYGRASLSVAVPLAVLPGHKAVTLVVRFSPILYELRGAASAFALPYRMVYAVATQESVFVYDTQQSTPLYCFSNLHYAPFTDLAWSADGHTLMMSSTDGYCSVAVFDYNELGVPLALDKQPCLEVRIPVGGKVPAEPAAPNAQLEAAVQPPIQPAPDPQRAGPKKRRVALTFEGPLQ